MGGPPQTRVHALLHAAGTIEHRIETKLSAAGLSIAKLAALHQLMLAGESLPLGQLAERLSCVKSNVTQLVDRLEAEGLVSRSSAPGDRRTRLATVTPKGRKAYGEGMRLEEEAEREIFGVLSGDESLQLSKLIGKLA